MYMAYSDKISIPDNLVGKIKHMLVRFGQMQNVEGFQILLEAMIQLSIRFQ